MLPNPGKFFISSDAINKTKRARWSRDTARHAPRKRGIQYPPPSQISRKGRRLLDRPLSRTMTVDRSIPIMPELSRVRARYSRRLGDQARAALTGEIGPNPLMLHPQPILQLRQR